uniref:Small ribosomal subunit protein uS3m n=1 Tax=Phallus echinovolvatus TaxID=2201239 RepID=A0A7D5J457_9AGAM|nr:ribosomal protein S3 [Phallus echinovolvatus]QLD96664.1 ribosomal protein S3 [Phallus echinovolvatus]
MQNKLKIKNVIKLTYPLELKPIQKYSYKLKVVYLKRDYSDSITKKINNEEVLINNLSSKQAKDIYPNDLFKNKNINLSKDSSNLELKILIKEKEWKEIWTQKFNKYKNIGKYLPTISDRLSFSYLQERKLNLTSKYSFNNFLSSSKVINYSFQHANKKVDLNSLYKLLKSFFKTLKSLISFPILKNTPKKLKILLFYYVIPNNSILKARKNYQNYIRNDDKLFKDTILRTNLIKIISRFKMILFISKWKENNTLKLPNLNNKTNSLSIPLVYKIQESLLENTNLTNKKEIEILKNLGLNISNITEKEKQKIAVFKEETIQYNLNKLIPFYKNLVTLLFEKDLNLDKDLNNHLKKNIKFLNSNNCVKINKILVNNLLNKLSFNKDLNTEKLIENFESLNIGIDMDKENKLIKVSSIEANIEKINLEVNISKLQLENSHILNIVKNTSVYKIAQELILIYSELNLLKEKIKNQETFKKNYKLNIIYSLNFLNKLILFFIKLRNYKIILGAKQKELNNSIYGKLENLNFEIEGLEELNLEKLEKFYNDYSNLKINSKLIYILQEKQDIYSYLKLPSIKKVLTLIKEQNFEFSEEPLIMNYSNPYAYKNANLLLITALHSLYRAMLIEHLNKINGEKYFQKKSPINEIYKLDVKDLKLNDSLKIMRERLENLDSYIVVNDSKKNLNILSNIESNNGSSLISLNKVKFKYLISFLEKIFNKKIELELIRLKYPAHNSNILAQVLALSSKNLKFFTIMRKLLYNVNIKHTGFLKHNFNIIPSYLSGIKIRLGGRLSTEKLIPRKTVKTYQIGSIARNKVNYKDNTRVTLKNKRGVYSLTVITSHIFNTNKKIKY